MARPFWVAFWVPFWGPFWGPIRTGLRSMAQKRCTAAVFKFLPGSVSLTGAGCLA
jgi:hypothetical protein